MFVDVWGGAKNLDLIKKSFDSCPEPIVICFIIRSKRKFNIICTKLCFNYLPGLHFGLFGWNQNCKQVGTQYPLNSFFASIVYVQTDGR